MVVELAKRSSGWRTSKRRTLRSECIRPYKSCGDMLYCSSSIRRRFLLVFRMMKTTATVSVERPRRMNTVCLLSEASTERLMRSESANRPKIVLPFLTHLNWGNSRFFCISAKYAANMFSESIQSWKPACLTFTVFDTLSKSCRNAKSPYPQLTIWS